MTSPSNPTLITPVVKIDAPDKFSAYCSSTETFVSGWDIRIAIMESIPPQKTGEQPFLLVHGTVVMSPIHAKALAQALGTAVAQYEEKFGVLDVQRVMDFQAGNATPR
jgi:hypothetical protein